MKKLSEIPANTAVAADGVEIDWSTFQNLVPAPATLPDQEGAELVSLGLIGYITLDTCRNCYIFIYHIKSQIII